MSSKYIEPTTQMKRVLKHLVSSHSLPLSYNRLRRGYGDEVVVPGHDSFFKLALTVALKIGVSFLFSERNFSMRLALVAGRKQVLKRAGI